MKIDRMLYRESIPVEAIDAYSCYLSQTIMSTVEHGDAPRIDVELKLNKKKSLQLDFVFS